MHLKHRLQEVLEKNPLPHDYEHTSQMMHQVYKAWANELVGHEPQDQESAYATISQMLESVLLNTAAQTGLTRDSIALICTLFMAQVRSGKFDWALGNKEKESMRHKILHHEELADHTH